MTTKRKQNLLSNLRIIHKGLALLGFLLAIQLVFATSLVLLVTQAQISAKRAQQHSVILAATNKLFIRIYELGHSAIWFVRKGLPEHDRRYRTFRSQIEPAMSDLVQLVQDDKDYTARLDKLRPLVKQGLQDTDEMVALQRQNTPEAAVKKEALHKSAVRQSNENQVVSELQAMMREQEPLIQENTNAKTELMEKVKACLIVGVIGNVFFSIALFLLFVRTITRRVEIIVDNTARLADARPLHPRLQESDEVGQLDQAFHEMAESLAQAQKKERAAIENAGEVICSLNSQGVFQRINSASIKLWGYRPAELVGQPITKLVQEGELINIPDQSSQQQDSRYVENTIAKADGSRRDMLWATHWSELDKSWFCVAHDITERKQNQRKLQLSESRINTILEHTLVGLVTMHENGDIETLNPRAEKLLGYTTAELAGRSLSVIFPANGEKQDSVELLRDKALNQSTEIPALRKDGKTTPVEFSLNQFDTSNTRMLIANLVDVSERHRINEMKQQFVNLVSQDFRTPLDRVRAFLSDLAGGNLGKLSPNGITGAQVATRNTGRLLSLLNDLLEASQFEPGKVQLNCLNVQVHEVLERALEAVRVLADRNNINLECTQMEQQIWCDPDKIERVVINLLSNAIKFSPAQGTVKVEVAPLKDRTIIKVIDHGRGIPANHINAIFERFQQVEVSDAKQKGGTGLGLTICKAIVEEHGGEIGVNSEEGQGSTFWFWLPCNN